MDPEKILAVLYKAAGLDPKKASPADLINAVQAYEKLGLALKGASEDAAEEPEKEEEKPADEPPMPEMSADIPALSATPADAVKLNDVPAPEAAPVADSVSLADEPAAIEAAGKQVIDKLMQALQKDAAGCVAFVSDKLDAIVALDAKQPESGQPSDKPADAAPALSVAASAKLKAEAIRLSALEDENVKLRAEVAKSNELKLAAEKATKVAAAKASVNKAVETGRVLAAEREDLETYALSVGVEAFEKYIGKRQPVVSTGRMLSAEEPASAEDVKLSDKQQYAFNAHINSGATREHAMKRALEVKSSA
ncbi:MAG: hypothetical protein IPK60_23005 [Sandaracinaceae bacterium]|nr:hypothetical protein [Sandaracinaceae bacterium]